MEPGLGCVPKVTPASGESHLFQASGVFQYTFKDGTRSRVNTQST